jgi:hypothetical protein
VPQSGTIGMGISILSYADAVYFGLITDSKLVPEPNQIIGRFGGELEQLLMVALMADSGAPITPEAADALLAHYAKPPSASPKAGKKRSQAPKTVRPRRTP